MCIMIYNLKFATSSAAGLTKFVVLLNLLKGALTTQHLRTPWITPVCVFGLREEDDMT